MNWYLQSNENSDVVKSTRIRFARNINGIDFELNKQNREKLENKIKENLSEYELSVLYEYEKGHSYADIAEKLKTKVKSVDTAIQRIKKKANKIKESIDS